MAERSLGGHRVSSVDRRHAPSDAGRVCEQVGCETRLSIYNDLDFCSLHQPMVFPRMRGVILEE